MNARLAGIGEGDGVHVPTGEEALRIDRLPPYGLPAGAPGPVGLLLVEREGDDR
ncbi:MULTISPECIES: hypothetical protein [Streptomyces]|uniref:Uncharacterized protein n=1 Tax=Streptomyces thermogriseus TaxID=75292 RepID=A0ABN1SR93_9ACTN|nr:MULTISPECIES: hypothetical protein [Streptomyces]MDN5382306.1 hypothetical protein [Streptomyces sp. LB8]